MSDVPDDLPLAAEFPAASLEQWRKLAEGVLKGARFEERLRGTTADGLTIEPLYRRARDACHTGRPMGVRWQVLQRVDHPDPAAANAQALDDLANGADGLMLVGDDAIGAHGFGLKPAPDTIARVLDRVQLDAGIAVELDLGPQTFLLMNALLPLVEQRRIVPEACDIRLGFDPLGAALLHGDLGMAADRIGPAIGRLGADLFAAGFKRAIAVADGRIVHGAGGTEAQELAYVIAVAVAYLRALEAHGIALDDARRMIFFRLAADADQFLTITKFRSLRKLWCRVEESCGLKPEPAFVCAETAWRMMTRNDPHLNILRATIAVFAAGLGGADAITVLPFTAARGLADPFARRIARNTQRVLLDEANLAQVADPAAGTGWSEELGGALCRAAWSLFQEIEAAGGAARALERGLIQEKVARARTQRERAVAARSDAIVGVTLFPEREQVPIEVLDLPPASMPGRPVAVPIKALAQIRLAEPFEPDSACDSWGKS